MSFVEATSVHALPCACGRLAFSCPTWQRPASSTMASMRARNLFLLENSAFKFDWSGVERRSKHDIFQSRYQLRRIVSPPKWAKERSHPMFWVPQNVAFNFWLYTAGYTTAHFTQLNKFSKNSIFGRKIVCDTALNPTYLTHLIQFRHGASLVHWKSATFSMNQAHW
jgi:hypothetical protein